MIFNCQNGTLLRLRRLRHKSKSKPNLFLNPNQQKHSAEATVDAQKREKYILQVSKNKSLCFLGFVAIYRKIKINVFNS